MSRRGTYLGGHTVWQFAVPQLNDQSKIDAKIADLELERQIGEWSSHILAVQAEPRLLTPDDVRRQRHWSRRAKAQAGRRRPRLPTP